MCGLDFVRAETLCRPETKLWSSRSSRLRPLAPQRRTLLASVTSTAAASGSSSSASATAEITASPGECFDGG